MAFGSFNPARPHQMMADINVTPMVDVMLVLLVIFIITAPMFTYNIKLDLPRAKAGVTAQQPNTISIAIDAKGLVYWNKDLIDAAQMEQKLGEAARQLPQPDVQLRADKDTRYELVAQVMAAAQAHGLNRLGFVTEPKKDGK